MEPSHDFGDKLILLRQTPQVKGLHTIIRNRDTSREDFIFYSDRLNRLLIEEGLSHLPFIEKRVTTPTGDEYVGKSSVLM
jgi:uracil phosphoribosyltransferase